MSENYKPGDIVRVRYGSVDQVGIVRRHTRVSEDQEVAYGSGGWDFLASLLKADGIDLHPLVVLDPEDMQQVKSLIRALRRVDMLDPSWDEDVTRAGVAMALRSLVAPPKPAEPRALGAVAKDAGKSWVHFGNGCWIQETPNACLRVQSWADFSDDVEVDR